MGIVSRKKTGIFMQPWIVFMHLVVRYPKYNVTSFNFKDIRKYNVV
jgi:hypothetical protein